MTTDRPSAVHAALADVTLDRDRVDHLGQLAGGRQLLELHRSDPP